MDKLRYDSFYKFLVSIGILLVAAPFITVYKLFTGSFDIIISNQEYLALSSISLNYIQHRVNLMKIIFVIMPYILIAFIIIGFFLIIWGGKKWYKIQKKLDEKVDLEVQLKQINIKKLTTSEVIEKAFKEITEVQDIHITPNLTELSNKIVKGLHIEDACFDYLNNKLSKNYNLQQNIKVGNNEYDIVATSKQDNIDLIYEIKYWSNPISTNLLDKTFNQIFIAVKNYEILAQRKSRFKLLIISQSKYIDLLRETIKKYIDNSNKTCSYFDIEYIAEEKIMNL